MCHKTPLFRKETPNVLALPARRFLPRTSERLRSSRVRCTRSWKAQVFGADFFCKLPCYQINMVRLNTPYTISFPSDGDGFSIDADNFTENHLIPERSRIVPSIYNIAFFEHKSLPTACVTRLGQHVDYLSRPQPAPSRVHALLGGDHTTGKTPIAHLCTLCLFARFAQPEP